MPTIRDDLEGVVYITRDHGASAPLVLRAGDKVPDGVTVGEHLLASREKPAKAPAASEPAEPPSGSDDAPVEPPRSGKGASKAAWAEYAATLGIELDSDASRDDLIAAVDEALGR